MLIGACYLTLCRIRVFRVRRRDRKSNNWAVSPTVSSPNAPGAFLPASGEDMATMSPSGCASSSGITGEPAPVPPEAWSHVVNTVADSDVEAAWQRSFDAAPAHRASMGRGSALNADQREVAVQQRSSADNTQTNNGFREAAPGRTAVPGWSTELLGQQRSFEAAPVPQAWSVPALMRREKTPAAGRTFTQEVNVAIPLVNASLGFCLALDDHGHAYVSDVKPGSVLDCDGRIRVGDRLIGIGGRRGEQFSDQKLITMMKEALRRGMLQMAVARDVDADYTTTAAVSLDVFDDINVDDFDASAAAGSVPGRAGQPTQQAALGALLVSDDNDGMSPADAARDRNSMPGVPERRRSRMLFSVEAHPHDEDGSAREASVSRLILNHTMV